MKNLSASKTLISLAVSSIFISHSAFAAVIFDDPNQDYVHQGGDLLINGGDSTLNAKSVNLGGGTKSPSHHQFI